MKKIIFFTLFLSICCSSIFAQPRMTIVFEDLDLTSGSFDPGEQLLIHYEAFNFTQRELEMHYTFKLYLDGELVYTQASNDKTIPNTTSNIEDSIPFLFPANCQIPTGDFELELSANFSQSTSSSQVRVSVIYDPSGPSCDELTIPASSSTPSPDCPEVFKEPLSFANTASCCTFDPDINITVTPFDLTWPPKLLRCEYDVSVDVLFANESTEYTLLWSHGNPSSTFTHHCGTLEYTVTVTWEQMGEECSKTSDPITVVSHCDCEPPTLQPPSGPPPLASSEEAPTTLTTERFVQIAPNPNRGHFHLNFSDEKEVTEIEVWNMMGQIIWQQRGSFNNNHPIQLSNASQGTYILTIQYADQQKSTQRFVIQ